MTAIATPAAPAAGTPEGTPAAVVTPEAPAAPAAVTPVAAVGETPAAPAAPAAPAVPATPAAPPAAVPAVPETFTLALPKDSPLDPKAAERVGALAKAIGLTTNEAAQQVLDVAHAEVAETMKVLDAASKPGGELYKTRVAEWEKSALAHPDLGANDPVKLNDSVLRAQLVVNRFAPELKGVLEETGYGSRPEVLLLLNRVAAAVGEKSMVLPTPAHQQPAGKTDAQVMYPEHYKTT